MNDEMNAPSADYREAALILHRAANWLEDNPNHHITGTCARDDLGDRVLVFDPHATCFCAVGRITYEQRSADAMRKREIIFEQTSPRALAAINDGPDKRLAIVEMRSMAAELARKGAI